MGEVLLVDRVHLGEVLHGGDEDVDLPQVSTKALFTNKTSHYSRTAGTYLDSAVNVAASVLENVLERLAAGLGLVGNAAANEVALRIGRNLTRDPDLAAGFNGLGLLRWRLDCGFWFETAVVHPLRELAGGGDLRSEPRLYISC